MVRLFESLCALILLFIVLPLFAFAWAGLRFSGVRPLFVLRQDPRIAAIAPLLEFNTRSSPFGLFLRRFAAEKTAAPLGVVTGKCRLADLIAGMKWS